MRLSPNTRSFIAGALLANSLPHLASAASGRRHMTPFGRHSSPLVNALWAGANLAAGCLLGRHEGPVGGPWDARLHALEAGALAGTAWMAGSEYALRVNTPARPTR